MFVGGARAKVSYLEKRYQQLLQPILSAANQPLTVLETLATTPAPICSGYTTAQSSSSGSFNQTIDLASILKASQTLSGALKLDELLHQLTQVILQNSGGDSLCLNSP